MTRLVIAGPFVLRAVANGDTLCVCRTINTIWQYTHVILINPKSI